MAIVEELRPCWTVTCDHCGDGDDDEYGGHTHWGSEREARDAVDGDWVTLDDGRLLCMSCWEGEIPDEVPCPRCGAAVGATCVGEAHWTPTCEERIEAWAVANPPAAATTREDEDAS